MLRLTSISQAGSDVNEDALFATVTHGFVIDGASGLYHQQIMSEETDAKWLAHELGKLLGASLKNTKFSIQEHIERATKILNKQYKEKLRELELDYDENKLPSASISAYRLVDDLLELYCLGDCPIYLSYKTGVIMKTNEPNLKRLEDDVINKMKDISIQENISILEARKLVQSDLIRNRNQKNTIFGYWIYDLTGKGIPHGSTNIIALEKLDSILIVSDGLDELNELHHQYKDNHSFIDAIKNQGFHVLLKQLRENQEKDKELNRYPRFKKSDDASGVLINIR